MQEIMSMQEAINRVNSRKYDNYSRQMIRKDVKRPRGGLKHKLKMGMEYNRQFRPSPFRKVPYHRGGGYRDYPAQKSDVAMFDNSDPFSDDLNFSEQSENLTEIAQSGNSIEFNLQ